MSANVDLVQDNVSSLSSSVDLVQDNVSSISTDIDTVSSNVVAIDSRVSANVDMVQENVDSLSPSIDLVQANLAADVGMGNVQLGIGAGENEITVVSTDSPDLYISANTETPSSNIYFASNLMPNGNAVFSIGAPDAQIKDIHVSDGTIIIGTTTEISADTIALGNFNVLADGTITIPGVNIAADANAVESVEIVASDLASNARIHAITGEKEDLVTANTSTIVAAVNEIFNKTDFNLLSVNTSITSNTLAVDVSANIGDIQIAGTNLSALSGTLTIDGTDVLFQGNLIV